MKTNFGVRLKKTTNTIDSKYVQYPSETGER